MTPEQKKFYDIKTTTDYTTVGDDVDYKVYVDDERKEVVLQFEESDSRQDWKNNLLCIPWPLKLEKEIVWTTLGYARAYKSTQKQPIEELFAAWSKTCNYKICVRGWSFGSAMAKIAVRHIEIDGWFVNELTTYGDVKCWLNPFYKAIGKVHEYVTPNDGVTWCVPFFHRDRKCSVGPRFSLKELFHSEQYHTHYEDYDYSKWEEA